MNNVNEPDELKGKLIRMAGSNYTISANLDKERTKATAESALK